MQEKDYERIARKLEAVEGRFEELGVRVTQPEVIADPPLLQKLMREHSELQEQAEFARFFRKLREDIDTARERAQGDDPELAEMGREELETLEPQLE